MNPVLIVTDFPSTTDQIRHEILGGEYGKELTRMLHEAGLNFTECDFIQLTDERPYKNEPERLFTKFTAAVRFPNERLTQGLLRLEEHLRTQTYSCIIALGEVSLWALTGECRITKWRGSFLTERWSNIPVIPTYHPREVMRKWDWRFIAVHDLRRVRQVLSQEHLPPAYQFTIRPGLSEVMEQLNTISNWLEVGKVKLSVDIETRSKHIACIGLGWSKTEALCIPFMCVENTEGYWELEDELQIINKLNRILTHPNALIIGQNFLYDLQYIARYWGIAPQVYCDTMITHAVCFPGTSKGLDFLSSLYCHYHMYWKDESKDWDPKLGEDQLWIYNCKDCVVTYEVAEVLEDTVDKLGLSEQVQFEHDLIEPLLHMMLRGTRIDLSMRDSMMWEMIEAAQEREQWFEFIMGDLQLAKSKTAAPWYRSAPQLKKLFYEVYEVPVVRNRKTGRPTTDDDALVTIGKREPLLYPLCEKLAEYRSIGVFLSTFIKAPLDYDKRMRCSYNPVGTETFRFNSSADAFGYGTNLQNIPKGG